MAGGLTPLHPTRVRKYYVPAAQAGVIGIGDCVIKVGDANDNEVRTGCGVYAPGALSEVTRATSGDGNLITGVVVSVDANPDDNGGASYRKTLTESVIGVADDPSALFKVSADAVMVVDDIGLNTNLVGAAGANTTSGRADVLADADASADASGQLLIIGMDRTVGNAMTDAAPELIVKINQHTDQVGALALGALGIA